MTEKELRESLGFKDKIVYHYCSLEAMYGIFSNTSFWLTSLESSNDASELRLAQKIIAEALKELKEEYPNEEYQEILNKIELAPKDKSFNKHKPRHKYYGLSFVEDKDSLTHWERYANYSSGVCIGFNLALIDNLFWVNAIPNIVSDWLHPAPIIYSHEEQLKYAKSSIVAKINGSVKEFEEFKRLEHIYSSIYYAALTTLKPIFKHTGFSSEKEHRIYLMEGEAETAAKLMKDMINESNTENHVLFKNISKNITNLAAKLKVSKNEKLHGVFKDGIRSYYSLHLKEIWSDSLIPEVVLGPKCFQNKKELKSFMKQCKLNRTKINVSQLPIR